MSRRAASSFLAGWTKVNGSVICSAAHEIAGNRRLEGVAQPKNFADIDVAVVRALVDVAEAGSLRFTEDEPVVNSLAYLAQHLVALLDPTSATGIEGVQIRGAQGLRTLTVTFIPRT